MNPNFSVNDYTGILSLLLSLFYFFQFSKLCWYRDIIFCEILLLDLLYYWFTLFLFANCIFGLCNCHCTLFLFKFNIISILLPAVSMVQGVNFFMWLRNSRRLMALVLACKVAYLNSKSLIHLDLARKVARLNSKSLIHLALARKVAHLSCKSLILLDLVFKATLSQKDLITLGTNQTSSRLICHLRLFPQFGPRILLFKYIMLLWGVWYKEESYILKNLISETYRVWLYSQKNRAYGAPGAYIIVSWVF